MELELKLSSSSVKEVIAKVKHYRDIDLPRKCDKFVERLAERGIQIAKSYTGYVYGLGNVQSQLIEFTKDVTSLVDGCKAIIVMADKMPMAKTWLFYGKPKTELISPTLMYEFGSGKFAVDGHRGEYPRSDGEPSKGLEDVWRYQTLDGEWHSFSGIKPTQPMYHMVQDLYNEVFTIAKEVFEDE